MPNTIDVKDRNDLDVTLKTQEYLIGDPADAAASSDTGTFSLIALVKRLLTKMPTLVSGRTPVDGSGVTQPVSAASLPLPASASTSTKQSDGSQKTQVVDGSGNVIGATSNALDINIKSTGVSLGTVSLPAHIILSPTVTVSLTAYTIDDVFGGLLTLTGAVASSGATSVLESFFMVDKSGQKPQFRVFIFNANPAAATLTDNAPVAFSTDNTKIIDSFDVLTGDWKGPHGTTAHYVASVRIDRPVTASGSANLYAALVLLNAPTMVSTADIVTARFKLLPA